MNFLRVAAVLAIPLFLGAQGTQYSQTITASGGSVTVPAGPSAVFMVTVAGSPQSTIFAVQGCTAENVCTQLGSYATAGNGTWWRQPAVGAVYDHFLLVASWSGGSRVYVTIDSAIALPNPAPGGGVWTDDGTTLRPPPGRNVASGATVLGPKTIGSGANQLPAAAACARCISIVTDGADATDATVGGGSTAVPVWSNGTAWAALGSGTAAGDSVTWVLCAAAACSTADAVLVPWIAASDWSSAKCYVSAGTPPTGTDGVTVQVLKNGVNAFTATLASGTAALTTVTSTPATRGAEGDNLTAAITAVGGTVPGANVTLRCKLQ